MGIPMVASPAVAFNGYQPHYQPQYQPAYQYQAAYQYLPAPQEIPVEKDSGGWLSGWFSRGGSELPK